MRNFWLAVILAVMVSGSATPTRAQEPGRQRQILMQQVMERLQRNYRTQAGLSDEEFEKFRDVTANSFQQRTQIQRRERAFLMALERQMRPGVAANGDSVAGLIDSLTGVQMELLELSKADQKAYAEFLTPVQRAQFVLMMRRFQRNIEQVMRSRARRPGGAPPQRRPSPIL